MKENKFTTGEDKCVPPSPPSTTTNAQQQNHKKHVRHHVKRRSSGRVHVAKLAPMIRANTQTDPETEQEDIGSRPTIRRSQSQRSLHRYSFDRKGMSGFTQRRKSTASERPADTVSPPSTPPSQEIVISTPSPKLSTRSASSVNPAHLTHQAIAAPVEQTLTAVANNLIIPDKAAYPLMATSPLKSSSSESGARKQPLRSQFIPSSFDDSYITSVGSKESGDTNRHGISNNNGNGDGSTNELTLGTPLHMTSARPAAHRASTLSRTQQKLMLQRQQAQVEDETSRMHPRNIQKLNRELELVGREYRCVKRYQDPMKESLMRCLENQKKKTRPDLSAHHHSLSTLAVPTFYQYDHQQQLTVTGQKPYIPHLEQRQAAHKHHHLKAIALRRSVSSTQSSASPSSTNTTLGFPWNATAFLERMFNNNS